MNTSPTMLSNLIKELTETLKTHGDIPVAIQGYANVYVSPEPYYYDGGAMLPLGLSKNGGVNWEKSRNHGKKYPTICHLNCLEPDENDSVNGEDLPTTAEFDLVINDGEKLTALCELQEQKIKKGWRK